LPGALQQELVDPFPGNVVHLSIREAQQDGHKKTWSKLHFLVLLPPLPFSLGLSSLYVTGKGFVYISLASRGSGVGPNSTLAEKSGLLYILLFNGFLNTSNLKIKVK
jgi:hypothetical protein